MQQAPGNMCHLFAWRVRFDPSPKIDGPNFYPSGMHRDDQHEGVADLIEVTTNVLSGGTVALMLLAVQRNNLELSIKQAIKW